MNNSLENKIYKKNIAKQICLSFFGMFIGLFLYEVSKQFIIPDITIWESHFITIIFGSVLSSIIAFIALKRIYNIKQSAQETLTKEEKLRQESDERFKAQFLGNPTPTFIWQKKGEDFELIDFNNAAKTITDGKVIEFLGKKARELYANRQEILRDLQRCFDERTIIKMETSSEHFILGRLIVITMAFVPPDLVMVHLEDITERKMAEERLRESEERYRNLFENAAEAIYVAQDGKIVFLNPRATTMTGYSSEELMSTPFIEFIHPDDRDKVIDRHVRRMKGEEIPQLYDFRLTEKDGNVRWVELNVVAINWKGKPATLNFLSDITERKRAEEALGEALKENESLLHSLLNYMHDAMLIINWDGSILFANRMAAKIIDCERPEDLVGHNMVEYLFPDSFQKAAKDLEAVKADKTGSPSEYKMCTVTGRPIWVEGIGGKIIFHNVSANLVCIRDITDRKQAEEVLIENQRRLAEVNLMLQLVINTIPVRIFWKDLNLNYMGCNRLFAEDAGRQLPADLTGKSDYNMGWREQADLYRQDDQEVIDTGRLKIGYEEFQTSPEGNRIWLRTSKVPLRDLDGCIIGVLGTYDDITDRKRAEQELMDTLESLRKAVGTTIQVMVSAVEARDPYTAGHQQRVADLARAIAREMGLPQDRIDAIRMAGSIHDIGKLSIPAEILSKPKKLTNNEFSLIKDHSQCGYEILKYIESPWPLAEIVYQHHERMDGTGYPRNLKGDEILIEARILSVADVVESMASHRPYRASLGIEKALEEILQNKGILYDSKAVGVCLKLFWEKGYHFS